MFRLSIGLQEGLEPRRQPFPTRRNRGEMPAKIRPLFLATRWTSAFSVQLSKAAIALIPDSERKSYGHLSNASIYSRAADNAEGWRCEICVRRGKLRMVQRVEKLGTNLKTAFPIRPT
jgi:hypothetical protein